MQAVKEGQEFLELASRFLDTKTKTAEIWWGAFYEAMVRELYLTGRVSLPYVGYFTLKHKDGGLMKKTQPDGTVVYVETPPRDVVKFTPDDDFTNDVNMMGVTKEYRKRIRKGIVSKRDKTRDERAKKMLGDEHAALEAEHIKQQQLKHDFEERMRTFREQYEQAYEDFSKGN